MSNTETGQSGESKASRYLHSNGYTVIDRNFRCRSGEIDIIATKDRTLYFIEVKTRATPRHGMPYEAVTTGKMRRMARAAQYYLLTHDYREWKMRYAVVSILTREQTVKFYEIG